MDQKKIGSYIAIKRKEKNLTQEQLGKIVGVSKNAVSKWERGICMMDMSLLKPVSNTIGVSVNNLLAGEDVDKENIEKVADENIISLNQYNDLKSKQLGVIALAGISLILIIYTGIKGLPQTPFIILMCGYNMTYYFGKCRFSKNVEDRICLFLFLAGFILNTLSYVRDTF